jgi:hypothetical protein
MSMGETVDDIVREHGPWEYADHHLTDRTLVRRDVNDPVEHPDG